jgi:uncharacterized lipoprotein YddW (UPF0748 family)
MTSYCYSRFYNVYLHCTGIIFAQFLSKAYMIRIIGLILALGYSINIFAQQKKYEFRAAWIATVVNIDFPSASLKGAQADLIKNDFIRILDMHKNLGMNAVIVQVRPAADAFYPSQYEPWSEYLTGKQGRPPMPFFNPLQFMVDETHKRGLEFHAWVNPYRAVFDVNSSSVSPTHITKLKPSWFVRYGKGRYFDPGNPEVWSYVTAVIKDMVDRYDVDAIHFDDYFYPYKENNREFPDSKSFALYNRGLAKADWRRSNVDTLIQRISTTIKQTKPYVKFGISPFGIWRNKRQDSINGSNTNGSSCYDDLYADIMLWLDKKWIDYITPQLYWEIGHAKADYITLLNWWDEHTKGRHLYIGQAYYRGAENHKGWRGKKEEMPNQIKLLRQKTNVQGSAFFSSKSFENNPYGWNDSLTNNYYANFALIPPMPWIDNTKPNAPSTKAIMNTTSTGIDVELTNNNTTDPIRQYAFYLLPKNTTDIENAQYLFDITGAVNTKWSFAFTEIPNDWQEANIAITAVDRGNNESAPASFIKLKKKNGNWKLQ